MRYVTIFGTKFTNISKKDACDLIEGEINKKDAFKYYAVKDVALTVRSLENEFLSMFYQTVPENIFVDGKGLVYFSFLLRKKIKEMVGGPGIYYETLKRGDKGNYKYFILGSTSLVLKNAIDSIKKRHPKIKIVGARNGYFNNHDEIDIINEINASMCDVLFIGVSTPKREKFIYDNYNKFGKYVCIPIGGVLDVEAGEKKYAPKLIGIMGLEWLYRVIQEPKRLAKRYFYTHTKVFYYFLKEFITTK